MLFSFRCINWKGSLLDLPAHSMNENKSNQKWCFEDVLHQDSCGDQLVNNVARP